MQWTYNIDRFSCRTIQIWDWYGLVISQKLTHTKKTLGRGLIRQPNGRGFAMTPKWFNMVGCDLWMFID